MNINLDYTLRDAEVWADFSGDHNPIHFDLQYVRRMGGEHLSVHGMRAMLDIKRYLSEALLCTAPRQDFYCFSARLRQPVVYQTPYHLQIDSCGTQAKGKLVNSTTREICFNSKLAMAEPLVLAACGSEHRLSVAEVMALSQQFPGEATQASQKWGFLDALLFQLLVKSPETLVVLSAELPELKATTLIDVFAHIPVVQTHHETHFSSKLFTHDTHFPFSAQLCYVIQPMFIMGNKDSGFVLRAVIQASMQQQPLITTAVTLKTWPLLVSK